MTRAWCIHEAGSICFAAVSGVGRESSMPPEMTGRVGSRGKVGMAQRRTLWGGSILLIVVGTGVDSKLMMRVVSLVFIDLFVVWLISFDLFVVFSSLSL